MLSVNLELLYIATRPHSNNPNPAPLKVPYVYTSNSLQAHCVYIFSVTSSSSVLHKIQEHRQDKFDYKKNAIRTLIGITI